MQTSTLRPGLLVSLKSSVNGGVSYKKKTLEPEHIVDGETTKAKWQTERTVFDKTENYQAGKARSAARSVIHNVCILSAFGYLCPENKEADLEKAIAEAHRIVDEFNATAKVTRVSVYVMAGRIAPDDVEAVRAINSEVATFLGKMEEGIKNLDVKVVREAASDARKLGGMLSDAAQARVADAIEAARRAARSIAKSGDLIVGELDKEALAAITDARTAFLELDEAAVIQAPKAHAAALDLMPEDNVVQLTATKKTRRAALELDEDVPVTAAAAVKKAPARKLELD